MFDIWLCPNLDCKYTEKLKENEKCPECGAEAKKFGAEEQIEVIYSKHNWLFLLRDE
jgi:ssDNA-binding Zn-finger/Zn-ribbon topoisomerase 1